MSNPLFRLIQQFADRNGIAIRRHVSAQEQEALFKAIQPVRTEHELVRIGGKGDGGYLVPDDLEGITACFSPGVDVTADFERALLDRGLRTFQIDGSINDTPLKHERNRFEAKFLGIVDDENTITLDTWVRQSMGDEPGDLILQIDIEGHEWLALAQVSDETLRRFRIIVIELHQLDAAFLAQGSTVIAPVLDRLRRHFDIVHLHANNCAPVIRGKVHAVAPAVEATLLRRDRSVQRQACDAIEHPLDRDNVPARPKVAIPRSMYALHAESNANAA